jgi:hypothetical protein
MHHGLRAADGDRLAERRRSLHLVGQHLFELLELFGGHVGAAHRGTIAETSKLAMKEYLQFAPHWRRGMRDS